MNYFAVVYTFLELYTSKFVIDRPSKELVGSWFLLNQGGINIKYGEFGHTLELVKTHNKHVLQTQIDNTKFWTKIQLHKQNTVFFKYLQDLS